MMQQLLERGQAVAARAKGRAIERIAAQIRDELRGVSVETGSGGVVLRGRRLLARWLRDPALRFAAWRRG
jgi:hypothetical protein